MIEIWGKPNCPFCIRAKNLCETRQLEYTYYELDVDFTREELIEMFPTARTYPQIKVAGNSIGGFDQLGGYLEETGYNGTGFTL